MKKEKGEVRETWERRGEKEKYANLKYEEYSLEKKNKNKNKKYEEYSYAEEWNPPMKNCQNTNKMPLLASQSLNSLPVRPGNLHQREK